MGWTQKDYADYLKRRGVPGQPNTADVSKPPFRAPGRRDFALGRLPTGTMNRLEKAYDEHLWELRHRGVIIWHKFEALKFRLADNTFYTPDFAVLKADGFMEMHETKGFLMDDANVKIKVAASLFPFKFILVRKGKAGIWSLEDKSK